MKKIIATIAIAALAGCASPPTQEQIASADYGRDMTAQECVTVGQEAIASMLKDPMSAQFVNRPCFKGYGGNMPAFGIKAQFGWVQEGVVNAKNSYGGYTGFRSYSVIIKDGKAIRKCIADKDGYCVPTSTE